VRGLKKQFNNDTYTYAALVDTLPTFQPELQHESVELIKPALVIDSPEFPMELLSHWSNSIQLDQ